MSIQCKNMRKIYVLVGSSLYVSKVVVPFLVGVHVQCKGTSKMSISRKNTGMRYVPVVSPLFNEKTLVPFLI
jgi:hypothetical protein